MRERLFGRPVANGKMRRPLAQRQRRKMSGFQMVAMHRPGITEGP
jgi:hypothetical protein